MFGYFLCGDQGGKGGAMGLEDPKQNFNEAQGKVTFNDVAGVEEAKEEVKKLSNFKRSKKI